MKSYLSITAILTLWLCAASTGLAWNESIDVTPKNQKSLGLNFAVSVRKHKRTFIVDFVIPPTSPLKGLASIGIYTPSGDFDAPTGLSVPFMGLTRFPRDSQSTPKQIEWVHGIRLWLGEDSITGAIIQFEHADKLYSLRLADYARQ